MASVTISGRRDLSDNRTPGRTNVPALTRRAVLGGGTALALEDNGATYAMAQEVTWLEGSRFAVGRWDGTLSIFDFNTAPFAGPVLHTVVSTPSVQGVQMITALSRGALVTSNDAASLVLWSSPKKPKTLHYAADLDVATSGALVRDTLVVGHASGFLSIWAYDARTPQLTFRRAVDVRNPNPVNP